MTLQAGRIYGGVGRLGAARQGGATPWWLSGGISAANCIAAYQPKGAASLAASYTNLANPGTYTAAPGVAPTWDAVNGWTFNGTNQYLLCGSAVLDHNNVTCIVRADSGSVARQTIFTCTTNGTPLLPSFEINSDAGGKGMAILQPGLWRMRNDNCHDNGLHVYAFTTNLYPTLDALYLDSTFISGSFVGGAPSVLLTAANSMAIGVRTTPTNQLYAGTILALAFYSPRLSAAQVAALTAAMAAL